MTDNNNLTKGEFLNAVCKWYRTCDDRELNTSECFTYLQSMKEYLMRDIHFSEYAPSIKYIKTSVTTFGAKMQNISIKCCVLAHYGSYNQNTISSLGFESFLSDLTRVEL